jgi:hypothetical protein
VQLPQLSVPLQPSEMVPQFFPCAEQVVGVHPQTLAVPAPPHVSGAAQVPQATTLLQPSEIAPQLSGAMQAVSGVHVPSPHTFGVPPPPQD